MLFERIRAERGSLFRELCNQFGIKLVEGHVMSDHIHMSLSISQDMEWHR
ncbi:transposase [uncultured Bilophila sp.]